MCSAGAREYRRLRTKDRRIPTRRGLTRAGPAGKSERLADRDAADVEKRLSQDGPHESSRAVHDAEGITKPVTAVSIHIRPKRMWPVIRLSNSATTERTG